MDDGWERGDLLGHRFPVHLEALRAAGPEFLTASNWLLVKPEASVNDTTLAVMGPQLGYYYPEIVMQLHFSGAGIEAQGVAVPGLAMYMLIGRTEDYAWTPSGIALSAQGAELLAWDPRGTAGWTRIATLAGENLGRVTRLAVSADGRWLAFVAEEPREES